MSCRGHITSHQKIMHQQQRAVAGSRTCQAEHTGSPDPVILHDVNECNATTNENAKVCFGSLETSKFQGCLEFKAEH